MDLGISSLLGCPPPLSVREFGGRKRDGESGNPAKKEAASALTTEEQRQAEAEGMAMGEFGGRESFGGENQGTPLLSTHERAEHHPLNGAADDARRNGDAFREDFEVKSEDCENATAPERGDLEEETATSGGGGRAGARDRLPRLEPVSEDDITPELIRDMEQRYAAFVRDDVYGTNGQGPLPLVQKISVCFALLTVAPVRIILVLLGLVFYYSICKVCTMFRSPGDEEEGQDHYGHLRGVRRRVIVFMGRWLSRTLLFGLGFYRIKVTHRNHDVMQRLRIGMGSASHEASDDERAWEAGSSRRRAGVIVSNHISYLDILYHMSASFPSFVAKKSVAKLPLVGLISKCMGCVYVQRESKSPTFKGVSGIVTERLRAAHADPAAPTFLLFPEGTTTNGNYLLPFKTGAFLAGTPVLPVILQYPYARFSPAWETMSGVRHMLLLLCQFVNHLEVIKLPVYTPTAKECADPKTFASNVRNLMAEEGNLNRSDIGLHEKRVYHAALEGKIFTRSGSSVMR